LPDPKSIAVWKYHLQDEIDSTDKIGKDAIKENIHYPTSLT